jgi:hypothetical protein
MSGEGISALAHRMINDVLRTSRRRFLTQVGAAGLGIGVPVSMTIAQKSRCDQDRAAAFEQASLKRGRVRAPRIATGCPVRYSFS